MKHLKHLLTALLLLLSVAVNAHDFEVDGIYYRITSSTNKTVAVTYRGSSYYNYSNEYTGSVVIPETVVYNGTTYSVTSIGNSAFRGCAGLTSVAIPTSVASIGDYAFYDCSGLTSVAIPTSVASIGDYAFYDCSGLDSVVIPNTVTYIGSGVFYNTDWYYNQPEGLLYLDDWLLGYKGSKPTGSIVIKDGTKAIAGSAFSGCSGLTSVEIPNSVTSIGNYAFENCSGLTSVVIGNSVTSIGNYAFEDCSGLTSIVIPNSVTSIGGGAFCQCKSLKDLRIEDGDDILSLGSYEQGLLSPSGKYYGLFHACPLETLYLGRDLGYDNRNAHSPFYDISMLTSVTIGNSVTSIGEDAFRGCSGLTNIVIPNSVTSIGEWAFRDCSGLTSVVIGNSVTSIGNYAFEDCSGLTSVVIGNSVTSIGNYAFENCSGLTSIVIPNSVTSIGEDAFSGCSGLTSVVIGNSVKRIGDDAFYGCTSLKDLRIEDGDYGLYLGSNTQSYYGSGLFCNSPLETLYLGRDLTYSDGHSSFQNKSTLTSVTIGNSVTSFSYSSFYGCTGLKEVHISDLVAWCNIDFGGFSANPLFYAKNLYLNGDLITDLVIPDNVTEIKDYAFDCCSSLTSVTIPNSVTSIGSSTFSGCSSLTSIVIPNSVTSIGSSTFSGCSSLTSIVIPNSVTSIGYSTFSGCSSLTSIVIPNSVTSIGDYAFYGCTSLKDLRIEGGDGILYLGYNSYDSYGTGEGLFYDCPLETLYLGRNLNYETEETDGYSPFYKKSTLTSVTVGNSVTSIPTDAFSGCTSLKNLRIEDGDGILFLGSNTQSYYGLFCDCPLETLYLGRDLSYSYGYPPFYNISTLTSVTIGNSVTSIGASAFYGCSGLKEVRISDLVAWCNIDFGGPSANPLYYANNLYLNGDLITDLVIPDNVTEIKNSAFYNCSGLTSVVIPNSITSIGPDAFHNCSGLKEVHISDLVAWLNIDFGNAYANPLLYAKIMYLNGDLITDLVIPDNVTEIKQFAFCGCSGLTNVEIPNGVTSIGKSAFNRCSGLTNFAICDGVKTVGEYAFYNSSNLETLYIGNTIESIGDYAFFGCDKIKEIKVGLKKPIRGSENIFANATYDNATLYVPNGTKSLYEKREPWNLFFYIAEMDFTGIDEVFDELEGEDGKVEGVYYDLNGRVVENPANGIYIIDGKKVWVK